MRPRRQHWRAAGLIVLLLGTGALSAQMSPDAYQRGAERRRAFAGLAVGVPDPAEAIPETPRFWYRRSVKGGHEFVVVDAGTRSKRPAFDHARLAAALSAASGGRHTATTLPFSRLQFTGGEQAIEFDATGGSWRCDLATYTCVKRPGGRGAPPPAAPPFAAGVELEDPPQEPVNDVVDGMVELAPQAGAPPQGLQVPGADRPRGGQMPRVSPDGRWEAILADHNLAIRPRGADAGAAVPLTTDGTADQYYTLSSVAWSPDATRLVAYRVRPGDRRQVHFVESSPSDQVQPRHWVRDYAKPGDVLDVAQPVLFDRGSGRATAIDRALFPNPYSLSSPVWRRDGRAFTFEYNQRGHQLYRVLEVDGTTGAVRAVITEESRTFISYRPLVANPRDTGRRFRYDVDDGREIVWMSERDGWAHLFLYDGATGRVKQQITSGPWVVRAVDHVDPVKRQIWFQASGREPGQDPYFLHSYRINFDGTGLTALTSANGDHVVSFSSDRAYYVDTWSRVDLAPVSELRRSVDGALVMPLEQGDVTALEAAGWRPPEVFTSVARDGRTPIWGTIQRPVDFDPAKTYPVIESIYAGPQGSFVPKRFSVAVSPLTELGFIVVQIDGMGTNNRSKAFHDVAWQNLGDAGLPDRILWHRAVAAKYPWYDTSRVGIYGTSAGGQSALGALLFHPEFYKVAVANSGCHDNRMDKIWWNEQWMGWPIGPQYEASSNVVHAGKLQGRLLLVFGELDTNVDPSSTLQVANALIRANKTFDLIAVPGGGHGAGGAYYQRALQDFFVHHLLGVEPPDWNAAGRTD
jgi:dipeptidyl aminopeptidase/acylaminoacyl peptidase